MADRVFDIQLPFVVTKFHDVKAARKTEFCVTPSELVVAIENRRAPTKDGLPLLSQASYGDSKTIKGSLRHAANIKTVYGIEGDYDAGEMTFDEATHRMRKAGVEGILYTTPSNTPDAPRWRALCPTAEPQPLAARGKLVACLNGIFDGTLGPESFARSQAFYYGRVDGDLHFQIEYVPGRRIDRIAGELIGKASGVSHPALDLVTDDDRSALAGSQNEPDRELVKSALSVFPVEARNDRTTWLRIGMILHFAFDGSEWSYRIWCRWSEKSGKYNEDDQRRVWASFGRCHGEPLRIGSLFHMASTYGFEREPGANTKAKGLSISEWAARDAPPPDHVLGEVLHTASRAMLAGPTGLGKTMLALEIAIAIAAGCLFLHWKGSGKPRSVLYIDGEMSVRLMKRRIADAAKRAGVSPPGLFVLSAEDYLDMPPLNTKEGQSWIDQLIKNHGGIDFIVFDNLQALTTGNLRETDVWEAMKSWSLDLSRRAIGQLWIDHTGRDESHVYGDSTKEWGLTVSMLMERFNDDAADVAFRLKFTKARERAPWNQADFEPAIVKLADDRWNSTTAPAGVKTTPAQQAAMDILAASPSMSRDDWREACTASPKVTTAETPKSRGEAFRLIFQKLAQKNLISEKNGVVSIVSATDFDDNDHGFDDDAS